MTGPAVITISARNFWPRVRALARSLAAHHAELPVAAVLTDEAEGCFDPRGEPLRVVRLQELPLDERALRRATFGARSIRRRVERGSARAKG